MTNDYSIRFDYYRADGEGVLEYELEKEFKDMLDESFDPVNIFGIDYYMGAVLEATDPIHFREAFLGWINGLSEDGELTEA